MKADNVQEVILLRNVVSFEVTSALEIQFILRGNPKPLVIRFEDEEKLREHLYLLHSITEVIGNEEDQQCDRSPRFSTTDSTPQFVKITEAEWEHLANDLVATDSETWFPILFYPGEKILKEGITMQHRVYRIKKGTCRVVKEVPHPENGEPSFVELGQLQAGDIFGEIGLFSTACSTATVIAESLVEVQVIDAQYLKILQADFPLLVTKFYYFVCSYVANCIYKRELCGWSRQMKDKLKEELRKSQGTEVYSQVRMLQKKRIINYKDCGMLAYGEGTNVKEMRVSLESSILRLYSRGEQVAVYDLLVWCVLPEYSLNRITLVRESEQVSFRPVNDSVALWTNRLNQASISIQAQFLRQAPDKFFDSVSTWRSKELL